MDMNVNVNAKQSLEKEEDEDEDYKTSLTEQVMISYDWNVIGSVESNGHFDIYTEL